MQDYSLFDIIGPVMIGPSSSHTAGASKIGHMAAQIFDGQIAQVDFFLHGSFYKTAKGHGTDKALLAGIMKMEPDDLRIKDAFDIAKENGLTYRFLEADLGEVHPNTVKIEMTGKDGKTEAVIGSSIGAAKILITQIGDTEVEVNGDYCTLITTHIDKPGMIAKVSAVLAEHRINIAFMKVFRQNRGDTASLIVQVDEFSGEDVLKEIERIDGIQSVKLIKALEVN
ncbi:MAG: L-serine ammonia-lyase, iron-sulfur-dependent subunit beta [Eubacteriales bacterium]